MKRSTRFLSAILAALMLAGSLASCATSGESTDTQAPGETQAATEAETEFSDNLPDDLDYGADEVTIISRYKEGWTDCEIAVDGVKGEPVNDAVFERNKAVEERLNIKINSIEDDNGSEAAVVNRVTLAVQAGTSEYDIMAAACYTTLPATLNGTFINLLDAECLYLELDQPWWIQGFNEAIEYRGTQYAALGSMLLSMYRFGFVTVFNKDLFTDAAQPYPYEYVQNGTWTLDKQASLVPLFYRDNGDGRRDTTDTYGFASSTYTNADAYWSACKLDIIKKDDEGDFQLVMDLDRVHGAVDKIIYLFHKTDGGTYNLKEGGDDYIWPTLRQMFADGNAAMASFRFMELENAVMRSMAQDYGVVPMPKYDELQESHYTLLHDQFTVVAIPSTVTGDRLAQMSAVLEAMSSASYQLVKPAYYEDTLRTKIAQDPTAAEMMDIITDNVYIDAGILYVTTFNAYHHALRDVVKSTSNNSVSTFQSRNRAMVRYLEQLTKKLDKLAK